MQRKVVLLVGAASLVLLAAATTSYAQNRNGQGQANIAKAQWFIANLRSDRLLAGQVNLLDPDTGAVRPASNTTVYFIRKGQRVSEARTDDNGYFQAARLSPGVYTVVQTNQYGVAVFATKIMPAINLNAVRDTNSAFRVASLLQDQGSELIISALASEEDFRVMGQILADNGVPIVAPDIAEAAGAPGAPLGALGGALGGGGGFAGGGLGGLPGLLGFPINNGGGGGVIPPTTLSSPFIP